MISEYLRELMTNIDLTLGMANHTERRRALEDRLKFDTQGAINAFIEYGDWHSLSNLILDDIDEENRNEAEAIREGYTVLDRRCMECGESRPDDARVEGGMKCGICAYG